MSSMVERTKSSSVSLAVDRFLRLGGGGIGCIGGGMLVETLGLACSSWSNSAAVEDAATGAMAVDAATGAARARAAASNAASNACAALLSTSATGTSSTIGSELFCRARVGMDEPEEPDILSKNIERNLR